jgi:hypothetical protein
MDIPLRSSPFLGTKNKKEEGRKKKKRGEIRREGK